MIKNWTVVFKQIRKGLQGFINACNYLEDENRTSHQYTKIVVLNDARKQIIRAVEERAQDRAEKKLKGLRYVHNYTTSMMLSLPRDIRQPKDLRTWSLMSDYIITQVAREYGIDRYKLKAHCHVVLHDESASPDKNSHLNIMMSNVIDKQVVKEFPYKKTSYLVKNAFNRVVKIALKESNYDYMPKRKNVKNKPLFVARAEKAARTMALYKRFEQHAKQWLKAVLGTFKKRQDEQQQLAQIAAKKFDDFDEAAENSIADGVFDDVAQIEDTAHIEPLAQTTRYTKRKRRRRKRNN
ncbi:hypothetical protein [Paraglaciecola sp.]|uniref:hypothetical protein n=1 Tax=Paraglaciecola sp. TaxID=1920173 RepID=UPI003EF4BBD8